MPNESFWNLYHPPFHFIFQGVIATFLQHMCGGGGGG